MSEKQPGGVRRRRSRAEVDRLIAECEASGLKRGEFCAKHGLSLATLARYRKRRQRRAEEPSSGSRFLQVELPGAKPAEACAQGSELAVVLASGRRIEVRRGFDADLLVQLVQVLERVRMFGLGPATRIYLAAAATDMRKGFEGLYGLVRDRLQCEPLSGHIFVPSNAQHNRLKLLFYDGSGLRIARSAWKGGRFRWPKEGEKYCSAMMNWHCYWAASI